MLVSKVMEAPNDKSHNDFAAALLDFMPEEFYFSRYMFLYIFKIVAT